MSQPRCKQTGGPAAERLESRLFFSSSPGKPAFTDVVYDPATIAGPMLALSAAAAVTSGTPAGLTGPTAPAIPAIPAIPTAPATPTVPTIPTPPGAPAGPVPDEPPVVPVASVIRIDAGRGPHTDLGGRAWTRDEGFTGGSVSIAPYEVGKTFEDPLYYTRRWGNFSYSLQVPDGTYDVRLHFADPVHTGAGKRKFHVFAEGNLVLNRFDVAAYGGGKAALVRSLIVNVADGALDLRFQSLVDNAILSAIEVVPRATEGWTAMTSAPVPTTDAQAATVNGKLYVFGGFDATTRATRASNAYDPDADTWTKLADIPRPVTGAATTADGGNAVWMAGGFVDDAPGKPPTPNVWKYDVAKDAWTAGPALPEALAGAAMVRVGRKLRVFGGVGANGADSPRHYVFDLDRPAMGWRTSAPLPVARHHLGGAVINGKVYAVGGQRGADPDAGRLTDVHVYNWTTNRWTAAASLPLPRSHVASSTFVGPGNQLLVVGGSSNSATLRWDLSDVTGYDPATNAWTHREWLPGLRTGAVARVLANRLVVATGASGPGSPQSSVWTNLV